MRALVVAGAAENGQAGEVLVEMRDEIGRLRDQLHLTAAEGADAMRLLAAERGNANEATASAAEMQALLRYRMCHNILVPWRMCSDGVEYTAELNTRYRAKGGLVASALEDGSPVRALIFQHTERQQGVVLFCSAVCIGELRC